MKLIALRLRHFKGIERFELVADGGDVAVFGDNATGKTTIADAFWWLLFGKDSRNRTDFAIKTLDADGNVIHGLEHEVEAELALPDGDRLTLRKVYREKWTKKRGSADKLLTGHTTDHFVNGVPVKKAEYDAVVTEIADEQRFRLLTDPTFFNEYMHWQDRRSLLLEACGDVSDEDVIASEPELKDLPDILGGRSLDGHRKIVLARRKEINEELDRIPVRIDEVRRGLPDLPDTGQETLEQHLADLRTKRTTLEQAKIRATSDGAIAEKEAQIADLTLQQSQIRHRVEQAHQDAIRADWERLMQAEADVAEARPRLRVLEREQETDQREIARLDARIEQLRSQWHEINGREYDGPPPADVEDACAACGQALPTEQVEAARQKAQAEYEERLASFNERKAADLERINAEGRMLRAEADNLRAACDKRAEAIREAAIEVGRLESLATELRQRMEQVPAPDPMTDPEYADLQSQIDALRDTIATLRADASAVVAGIDAEIRALDEQVREIEAALGRIEQHERGLQRIEELKVEERRLAAEYEALERDLYLSEQFIRAKVALLEDKINSRFQMARFKLFNVLVNGGVEETCETTYQGVPYASLNNGARINVGLDIINTLSEHYGVEAPIFVDNRESVTNLIPTCAQTISLIVSAADKKLRVEYEHERERAKEAV